MTYVKINLGVPQKNATRAKGTKNDIFFTCKIGITGEFLSDEMIFTRR